MRDLAASGVPAEVSLQVLGLGRSPYYRWRAAPVTESELREASLANAIYDAHVDDQEFGYRFLFDEVTAAGHEVSERTVWRICSANEWWCVFGKKRRGKKAKVGVPAHHDIVRRDFTAVAPNRLWLTDLTEHKTGEGKMYLCAIKDVWSNLIVDYSISDRMGPGSQSARSTTPSPDARSRGRRCPDAGCIRTEDRSFERGDLSRSCGVIRCSDRWAKSAPSAITRGRRVSSLLQKNVLNRRRWDTREELRIAIVTWIERTYHRRRRQDHLGRFTPIEFELVMSKAADQAA